MSFDDSIAPRKRERSTHSGSIPSDSIDKTDEFGHLALFGLLEPGVQCLHLSFFEHGHKLLTQQIDGVQVRTCFADVPNLLLLFGGSFRSRQNQEKGSASRGKAARAWLSEEAWFSWLPL